MEVLKTARQKVGSKVQSPCVSRFGIIRAMKNLMIFAVVLAAFAVSAEPAKMPVAPIAANSPGFIAVTIKQGTNTVSNLPFTANMRPSVSNFYCAKKGDTFVWKEGDKEVRYTFDGKAWSGNAVIPTHESFILIRTANATDTWNVGGELDVKKGMGNRD